jgi:hypothetical protein
MIGCQVVNVEKNAFGIERFHDTAHYQKCSDGTLVVIWGFSTRSWRRGVVVKTVASCSKSSGSIPVCKLFGC